MFRASVARSARRGLEAVHREAIRGRAMGLFGDSRGRALRLGNDAGSEGFGGRLLGVVVEHRGEALAQMPFDVIGEHAQKDVSAYARCGPMEDRPDLQIDGLDTANSTFDLGEAFIGPDRGAIVEGRDWEVGADHIDAVEARLGVDCILLASE